jgi:DNA-binding transcriptional LysR family regulator
MSLAGVDLNLLVALDALLAGRNVTRAARRVGLSQPGMSNTLARLRKLFGDPLLVREGLTLVPTPRAEGLRQPVQEALSLCCVWARTTEVGDQMTMETYLRLGHLVYSAVRGHLVSIVDTYLTQAKVSRRIEVTVESFLLAPFLLQSTDLVAVVPERAAGHLRRTADVRFLEPPLDLPPITEMLWWNRRRTLDPAHAWLRARIAEIAAELDQASPDASQPGPASQARLPVPG